LGLAPLGAPTFELATFELTALEPSAFEPTTFEMSLTIEAILFPTHYRSFCCSNGTF